MRLRTRVGPAAFSLFLSFFRQSTAADVRPDVAARADPVSIMSSPIQSFSLPNSRLPVSGTTSDGVSTSSTRPLTSSAPTSTTATSSPSTSNASTATSSSASSAAATPGPASALSTHKTHNTGAIVGGVLGAVALIFIVTALLFFLRTRKSLSRSRARNNSQAGFGAGFEGMGKWGGLDSRDLAEAQPPKSPKKGVNHPAIVDITGGGTSIAPGPRRGHASAGSTGTSAVSSTAGHGSDSEVNTLEDGEKFVSGPYDTIAPLPYTNTNALHRSSTSSMFSDANANANANAFNYNRSRSSSTHQLGLGLTTTHDSKNLKRASVDGGGGSIRRVPVPSLDLGLEREISNASSRQEAIAMMRTPSSRRTQRKPVPKYDVAEFEGVGAHSQSSSVESSPVSISNTQEGHAKGERPGGGPALNTKSSFGNMKKMRYIMPDMPPPCRD